MKRKLLLLFMANFAFISLLLAPASAKGSIATSSFTAIPIGYAYGTYMTTPPGSTMVSVGPNVPTWLGCSVNPTTETNTGTTTGLGVAGSTGTVTNTITPTQTSSSSSVQTVSNVQNVNLFGGLIQASALKSVATSTLSATQFSSVATGSTFTGLLVSGIHITLTPPPNTQFPLPGLGYVILNHQNNFLNRSNVTGIVVDMMDIYITMTNSRNIPIGTEITIGHAYSYVVQTAAPVIVNAQASSLNGSALGSLSVSPGANADISCGGDTINNSLTTVSSPIASAGVTTASVMGTITSVNANVTSTATIANPNLLSGFIQADAITANAQVTWINGDPGSGTNQGSVSFTNGKIGNSTFSGTPYPNSWVDLPGIGYLILNEQFIDHTSTSVSEEVIAIDLYVTQSNTYNLPVGARIIVDDVHSGAVSYTVS